MGAPCEGQCFGVVLLCKAAAVWWFRRFVLPQPRATSAALAAAAPIWLLNTTLLFALDATLCGPGVMSHAAAVLAWVCNFKASLGQVLMVPVLPAAVQSGYTWCTANLVCCCSPRPTRQPWPVPGPPLAQVLAYVTGRGPTYSKCMGYWEVFGALATPASLALPTGAAHCCHARRAHSAQSCRL